MKRLKAILCSLLLLFATVITAVPTATALGPNLISNASAEVGTPTPTGWASNKWGTNAATFTHSPTAHTGTKGLTTKMTSRTTGDAKWYFTPVTVSPNTSYTFSNWYTSNAVTSLDIAITTTAGSISYVWKGAPTVSSTWKQNTFTFTTPANASKVTVYQSIGAIGEFTVDDYSLATTNGTGTPTPPTVGITAPAAGSTVSGVTNLTANASDAVAVSSVQFKVDGNNVGAADTTAPYSAPWDTTTATNASHTVTAVATNTSGLTTTSGPVNVNVNNIAPPAPQPDLVVTSVSWTPASPQTGNEVTFSATIKNQGTAATAAGVAHTVSFSVDGTVVNISDNNTTALAAGASRTQSANTGPASKATWTAAVGAHTVLASVDSASLIAESTETNNSLSQNFSVTNPAPTAPTVSITAPAGGATVSGTAAISANASDAVSVTSVQFKVDGTNIGAADTTAPYSVNWDSKSVVNGAHSITAVATNNSGLTTTSTPVGITVTNTAPPATTNLIANPSVEDGSTAPTGWTGTGWGTNTRATTYETTGHTGSRSVKTTLSSYTNGDAKWMFNSVPVTANTSYSYSNWYMSNVETELDAMVTMSDGTVQYIWLKSVPASARWAQVSGQFTVPSGAVSLTIFQVIAQVGYVQTDDYNLSTEAPAPTGRPLVSLTFDDGWRSIYTNGLPLLNKYGQKSTQYLNSTPITGGWDDYMTYQHVKDWAAGGHELAWHTRSHADVTTLNSTELVTELTVPNSFLTGTATTASTYKNFATPYGSYNTTAVNEIKKHFRSHRSTDVGFNNRSNFNVYNIVVQNITDTTTPATVQNWVNQAKANNTWLVLVYHEVSNTPADPVYSVTPANLDGELNVIKQSGVAVVTVDQAITEFQAQ